MQRSIHCLSTLQVYRMAFQGSVVVCRWAQPLLEATDVYLVQKFLATSQAARAYIAAAWGRRHQREAFIAGLSTAQLAAAEMQTWIEAAIAAGYLDPDAGQDLYDHYRALYMALDQLMAVVATAPSLSEKKAENARPAA